MPSWWGIRWAARWLPKFATRYPEMVERVAVSDTPAAEDLVSMPLLGKMLCWPLVGPALDHFRGVDAISESSLQTGFAADYPVPALAYRSLKQLNYAGVCDSKDAGRPVAETLKGLASPCWCCGVTRTS